MNAGVWGCICVLLAAACWTDLRKMRIPNGLTLSFAGGGILYQLVFHGIQGGGWALAGALSGMIPLYIMNRFGGIGGGDVKWFGAFGVWTGPSLTFQLLVVSILLAGGIACALLAMRLPGARTLGIKLRWPWGTHPSEGGRSVKFPFMLAVAPGFMILLGKG
ncbi:A24 family peptidase [Cohnella terricola]|uniref:A24 family peptidase n=1 Tax=Cohnella terricola TaxID=1289167 RepID=UPI001648182D|nr:A24 family peptidase [Cohnella terricola]